MPWQRPELRSHTVMNGDHFLLIEPVGIDHRTARKLAWREHTDGIADGAAYRGSQLEPSRPGKELRVGEEADIVYAHHNRRRAEQWRRVLHVQQRGPVLS